MPCPSTLGYANGGIFDHLVAGWVQYWSEILVPSEALQPNLVKALIASESDFVPRKLANKKNGNSARGLMQITNETRKILGDIHGELHDHFVTVTRDDLYDPCVNICVGVRWLFYKKNLATRRLKRDLSWLEAVFEYKGLSKASPDRARELMRRFNEKYELCNQFGK